MFHYYSNFEGIFHFNWSNLETNFSSFDECTNKVYNGYRDKDLPERYTAYGENVNEEPPYMYDRYEYDRAESPTANRRKQSLCKRIKLFCHILFIPSMSCHP